MSASIYWRPASDGKRLQVNAPSNFLDILGALTGHDSRPDIELDHRHVLGLRALVRAGNGDAKAFQELADAIEKHDSIIVTARY